MPVDDAHSVLVALKLRVHGEHAAGVGETRDDVHCATAELQCANTSVLSVPPAQRCADVQI